MNDRFPDALERLISELSRLPTIGRKSAQRLAFQLLKSDPAQPRRLAQALEDLHNKVHFCRQCFYVTEGDLCGICLDERRDPHILCVVEEPMDVASFERTGAFKGYYHVLLGRLSPLQGVMPEDLKINELVQRIQKVPGQVSEVIMATNPNVDGDATALYLSRLLEPLGVRTTRLGLGLPIGSSLEYTDELTLQKALESRKNV